MLGLRIENFFCYIIYYSLYVVVLFYDFLVWYGDVIKYVYFIVYGLNYIFKICFYVCYDKFDVRKYYK